MRVDKSTAVKLLRFSDGFYTFLFSASCTNYRRFGGCLTSAIGCLAVISNPCISIRYCSSVSSSASFAERGHRKAPLSRRLYSSRKPSPSHSSALIRSLRLPQKRNSVFLSYGSRENWKRTIAVSPSIPRRRSVNPGARYTFLNCETRASFSMAESLHKAMDHLRGNIRKDFYRKPICIPDTGHRCCCVMSGIRKKRYSFRTLPAWDRELDKSRGSGIWKQVQACFPDTFETVVIVCFCNTMLGAPGRHVHFLWTVLTVPYLLCPLHEADLLCYYAGL